MGFISHFNVGKVKNTIFSCYLILNRIIASIIIDRGLESECPEWNFSKI